ncbi:dienelactone hydrolase family protein [Paracraurococcus ruber]|uniref:hypothetical protein n=1 Tax=Paracraurococcus ruber TaxID=77675 RepID=UPI0010577370|nr:hypothetical protein [Paracraurococcus ruber]TDG33940.1 hypothetical protein E2C05_01480 [Paracraurococcus ruber]
MRAWFRMASQSLALASPLLLANPATAGAPRLEDLVSLVALGSHDAGLLTMPAAGRPDRPAPVVVILPDTDGAGPRTGIYAQRLVENGYAVLEASFGGNDPEEGHEASVALPDHLPLVLAAIAAEPRLDLWRIAVVGLGQGARAAVFGLAKVPDVPVAGVALLYPGCDAALAAAARSVAQAPRILLLHGDEDTGNDPGACATVTSAFPVQDHVRQRVLAGATFAWDAYALVRPGGRALLPHPAATGRRSWVQPDPGVTTMAADQVLALVVATLGRP